MFHVKHQDQASSWFMPASRRGPSCNRVVSRITLVRCRSRAAPRCPCSRRSFVEPTSLCPSGSGSGWAHDPARCAQSCRGAAFRSWPARCSINIRGGGATAALSKSRRALQGPAAPERQLESCHTPGVANGMTASRQIDPSPARSSPGHTDGESTSSAMHDQRSAPVRGLG